MPKKKKVRTDFRKNRTSRTRPTDWTRQFDQHGFEQQDTLSGERVSGKGELTRRRTVLTDAADPNAEPSGELLLDVDSACLRGRVLSVHGLASVVEAQDGSLYQCATRRILKTLSTDQRHVVSAGDKVQFRPAPSGMEGIIERVEPRHGVLSRSSRGRQQILVTNVDQILIVSSAAEPYLKPNLIDRFLSQQSAAASAR